MSPFAPAQDGASLPPRSEHVGSAARPSPQVSIMGPVLSSLPPSPVPSFQLGITVAAHNSGQEPGHGVLSGFFVQVSQARIEGLIPF